MQISPSNSFSNEMLRAACDKLFKNSKLPVVVFDRHDRHVWFNAAYAKIFHVHFDEDISWTEMMRRNFKAQRGIKIESDDFERWLTTTQARRADQSTRVTETNLVSGEWMMVTEIATENQYVITMFIEITDSYRDSRAARHERDLALNRLKSDHLTGLATRQYFNEIAAETIANPSLANSCFAILDIDYFKKTNDTYGHQSGDQVLVAFAGLLSQWCRQSDTVARYGGEEFVVILRDTSISQARQTLDRLRDKAAKLRPLKEHPEYSFTISAGVAHFSDGSTVEDIAKIAERRLYVAKETGRNQVISKG